MKKILCAILVVALVVCGAFAIVKNNESTKLKAQLDEANTKAADLSAELDTVTTTAADLQAQLDAAAVSFDTDAQNLQTRLDEADATVFEMEAAIADLEAQVTDLETQITEKQAQVELYKPFYDAQVIVEYNGGVIMKDAVMEAYAEYEAMAAQNGIDLAAYGMDAQFKQMSAEGLLQDTVTTMKAVELGLDQLDEATLAGLTEQANANFESFVAAVEPSFTDEEATAEEIRTNSVDYLASLGYTLESMQEAIINSYITDQLYNHVTADVTITDEDVQAAYDELVAEQEASFVEDSSYNSARNNGEMIVWNPEGYRAVKHVLVKFSDEQSASMKDLVSTMASLKSELEALSTEVPAQETEDGSVETAEPRTAEEINADIAGIQAEINALYAELMPRAEEVIAKFNEGVAFADLIAEYNEDPGMANEPIATNGYAVAVDSTTWDPAFRDGAMSIESVGSISAPVKGSYGIHVIYYESDIPAGPVAFDAVRADLESSTLETKLIQTYNAAVEAWIADAAPVYHLNNLEN